MSTATLLVELVTEELPPKVLRKLGDAFSTAIFESIRQNDLTSGESVATMYASPRRLAVSLTAVKPAGRNKSVRQKLMPVKVAFGADGKASPALIKRLEKEGYAKGVMPDADFTRVAESGTEYLYLDLMIPGQALQVALTSAIQEAIKTLPVPKLMSYQLADGETTVQFVRPARGLIALHGTEVIAVHALGLNAGRMTQGHRFQGATSIELKHADEYPSRLEMEGGVIAGFDRRRDEIHRMLRERADQQLTTLGDYDDYQALLDEVTGLVEMPTVYVGEFEREFLEVPAECLILTMKVNQKYFPLFLNEGGLSSRFLIVSNMRLDDPRNVIEGNQRVVRPRLADARFFFETDRKVKLEARVPKLAQVVYHNKLGSQGERIERVRKLAAHIAGLIGADAKLADRAALLAKADLVTDMVGEFPELQGIMGRYYALHDGEVVVVADAIQQHYQPRFAGDKLPDSPVAVAVALADKIETLAGLFKIGQHPTGDKDPFGLRRQALGVLRIVVEKKLDVDLLGDLINPALDEFKSLPGFPQSELLAFILDRARGYAREQGYTALEVEAVLGRESMHLSQLLLQLEAVREFTKLPEAESLAAANKRIGNILKKSDQVPGVIDASLFAEPAERKLYDAMQAARVLFTLHFGAGDYTGALKSLAPLKAPVDAFFEGVMVNVEDSTLRANRLALLNELHVLMNKVADLSRLAT